MPNELITAVKEKNLDEVKRLLATGANPDKEKDPDGNTPLMLAARNGSEEIAKKLLGRGANLLLKNHEGKNALMLALEAPQETSFKHLYDHLESMYKSRKEDFKEILDEDIIMPAIAFGIIIPPLGVAYISIFLYRYFSFKSLEKSLKEVHDFRVKLSQNDLIKAVCKNDIEEVKRLLAQGIDPNVQDISKSTALIWAVNFGYDEIAKKLLDVEGIKTNLKDEAGRNALIIASWKGRIDEVNLILEKSGNAQGRRLINAIQENDLTTVKELLATGIDPDQKYDMANVAYLWSVRLGRTEILQELLSNKNIKINLEVKDDTGAGALILATRNNHLGVVEVLLRKIPNILVEDNDGNTAYKIAQHNPYKIKVFREILAEIDKRAICSGAQDRWDKLRERWGLYGFTEVASAALRSAVEDVTGQKSEKEKEKRQNVEKFIYTLLSLKLGEVDPFLKNAQGKNALILAAASADSAIYDKIGPYAGDMYKKEHEEFRSKWLPLAVAIFFTGGVLSAVIVPWLLYKNSSLNAMKDDLQKAWSLQQKVLAEKTSKEVGQPKVVPPSKVVSSMQSQAGAPPPWAKKEEPPVEAKDVTHKWVKGIRPKYF